MTAPGGAAAACGTYPLPRPDDDPRFTWGLLLGVAEQLTAAGYPELTGTDLVHLQQALFGFLYAPSAPPDPRRTS